VFLYVQLGGSPIYSTATARAARTLQDCNSEIRLPGKQDTRMRTRTPKPHGDPVKKFLLQEYPSNLTKSMNPLATPLLDALRVLSIPCKHHRRPRSPADPQPWHAIAAKKPAQVSWTASTPHTTTSAHYPTCRPVHCSPIFTPLMALATSLAHVRWAGHLLMPGFLPGGGDVHLADASAPPPPPFFPLLQSTYFSMVCTRAFLGTAPMTESIFLPPLKIMTVGMLRMPYSVATVGLSSVFSLT
jgi:hypothetical protein